MMQMLLSSGLVIRPPQITLQHGQILSQSELASYSNQVKNLYAHIFQDPNSEQSEDDQQFIPQSKQLQKPNNEKQINFNKALNFKPHPTPMPVCQQSFSHKNIVFRCYDCSFHESAILCIKCFQKGNHQGHRFTQMNCNGGICDCGNPDVINSKGFCANHPGKAEPVALKPEEQQRFNTKIGAILQWIFRLSDKPQYQAASDYLGVHLANFILQLNDKSLYYNTLTYNMLFSQRKLGQNEQKKKKKIIESIFECGNRLQKFAQRMTDLFLSMFSLDVFKYELTVCFAQAYNTIQDFECSQFRYLYVQIFAHNQNIERMLDQKKLILYPTKSSYNFPQYMSRLNFVTSMKKKQVVSKYFKLLIQKGHIRFPQLDIFQQHFSYQNQEFISYFCKAFDFQYRYYNLNEQVIKYLKNDVPTLLIMLKNYLQALMDPHYKYRKNKMVKPFHKVFAMILLAIAKGNLENVEIHTIKEIINKWHVLDIFSWIFQLILESFTQFATNSLSGPYFSKFNQFYIKMGATPVVYDILMFKICLKLFSENLDQKLMNDILLKVFQISVDSSKGQQEAKCQNIKDVTSQTEQTSSNKLNHFIDQNGKVKSEQSLKTILKKLQVNIELLNILVEGCISQRSEIVVANRLNLENKNIQHRTQQSFISVMMNFKQISQGELQKINKYFLSKSNFEAHLIKNFLTFDKNKKKYSVKQDKSTGYEYQKEPIFLYPTITKSSRMFATDQSVQSVHQILKDIKISKSNLQRLSLLFNDMFLSKITEDFIVTFTNIDHQQFQNQQVQQTFTAFLNFIYKLEHLMKQNTPKSIFQFNQKINSLKNTQGYSFLRKILKNQQTQLEKAKLQDKIKYDEKRKKKLDRIRKMQQSYTPLLSKVEQKNENESICMICRDNNGQSLCFLANFKYSNLCQALIKVEGRSLQFVSCFHPIHMKCFIQTTQQQFLKCPLCKAFSTIMLPLEKHLSDQYTIKNLYQRIITIRAIMTEDSKSQRFDRKFEDYGILSILRALSSMIGMNLLRNQHILRQKQQRLANILYGMLKVVNSKILTEKDRQLQMEAIQLYLQVMKKNIQIGQRSNYHAVQYLIIQILRNCLTNKSSKCVQILSEQPIKFLNSHDLRKIWQMCDQIASLPYLNQVEQMQTLGDISTAVNFYRLPQNVFELIKVRDQQKNCNNGHQICVCIICQEKTCYDCSKLQEHFILKHSGEGLSVNLLNGKLMYFRNGKTAALGQIYCDQIGSNWTPSKSPDGYVCDIETYSEIKQSILNNNLIEYLKKKYAHLFNKS